MKKIIVFLSILFTFFYSNATNYYVSSSTGNDANSGTSQTVPWKTISKVNNFFNSLNSGDSVLFKRGEIFLGGLIAAKSGILGNPIIFDAYGTGAKPIFTGFVTVNAWTPLGNGIYESTSAVSTLATLNMVTLDGAVMAMGRYPKIGAANKGYLTYQSGTNGTLTSNAISGASSFVGGEINVRLNGFTMDRCVITAQSPTVVTYTPQTGATPSPNFGFFFENHPNTLTQTGTTLGEWYFDPSTKKIRMYFGANNPASYTIKISSIDNVITSSSKNYITFNNISLQGSNTAGISFTGGTGDIVQNCDFIYNGVFGIRAISTISILVTENYAEWNGTSSIGTGTTSNTSPVVTYNTVRNNGMFVGMQWKKSNDDYYDAISAYTASSLVRGNTIINAGYNGIGTHVGNNMLIDSNHVDSVCIVKDDGGCIYTWTSGGTKSNMRILHNVVMNAIGAPEGTDRTNGEGYGIYLDDSSNNIETGYNTIANCRRGIFAHNNRAMNIHDNTVYDCFYQFRGTGSNVGSNMTGFIVKNNIFFAKDATQLAASHSGYSLSTFGSMDSNYYCRPISEPNSYNSTTIGTGGVIGVTIPATKFYSLDVWKTIYPSLDINSHKTSQTTDNVNKIRFEYNPTNQNKTIVLIDDYTDIYGITHSVQEIIPPYSSIILMNPITNISLPINIKKINHNNILN